MIMCGDHPHVMGLVGWFVALADNHDIVDMQQAKYYLKLVMPLMDTRCVSA